MLLFLLISCIAHGQENRKLDSLWTDLVNQKLCFGGFQYVQESSKAIESENLVVNHTTWKILLQQPKSDITPFLLEKFQDTLNTNLHTCPFFATKESELALYVLQHVHQRNWYDFAEFKSYADRDIKGANDQPQGWLQAILADEKQLLLMINLWRNIQSKN